jgi:hypothetical protein
MDPEYNGNPKNPRSTMGIPKIPGVQDTLFPLGMELNRLQVPNILPPIMQQYSFYQKFSSYWFWVNQ